jgi:16S rRNA processing protein RimM
MIKSEEITRVGTTLKPHGIKGEISILHDEGYDINELSCIILCIDGIYVPFFMESIRTKTHETSIVKLKGYNDEVEIGELSGLNVFALNSDLPLIEIDDEEGFYPEDFIDYNVIDEKGVILGKIEDVDVSTENALFIVVKPNGNEFYIPIADEFIIDINVDTLTIQMDLPLGLVEIN